MGRLRSEEEALFAEKKEIEGGNHGQQGIDEGAETITRAPVGQCGHECRVRHLTGYVKGGRDVTA